MYEKLGGMTGTADTEAGEFKQIYSLEVALVPTNRSMVRLDRADIVYRTRREKYNAVVDHIVEIHAKGQPVLVGTISIEQSETLSKLLAEKDIPHNVLNAKQHEREAEIIAQAGRYGAVTIATNMAGRGTDILLGGNPDFMATSETGTKDIEDPKYQEAVKRYREQCNEEHARVVAAGGLYVMGTERHEARRIDNQLRGRAGRQGDPGESRFYISLEDELMMRFQGERLQQLMSRLGWEEGMALDSRLMSRTIETAQKRCEGMHFESRKHVTEYDDVMNKQRQVTYNLRNKLLKNDGVREEIVSMIDDLLEAAVVQFCDEKVKPMDWELDKLKERFNYLFNKDLVFPEDTALDRQVIFDSIREQGHKLYAEHAADQEAGLIELNNMGISRQLNRGVMGKDTPLTFEVIEQDVVLETLDYFWRHHLQEMDHLREGIGLRGYGQKNPLYEYQREGFLLFESMLAEVRESVIRRLCYHDSVEDVMAYLEVEKKRREALEQQMQVAHPGDPEVEVSAQEAAAAQNGSSNVARKALSPEDIRTRLEEQKRARRKAMR